MLGGWFSSYSRVIDWARMADIAKSVGAYFFVDMAHVAGLVAAGVYPSPLPHADVVTSTTHKTLRGPRGGIILARRNEALEKKFQSLVFRSEEHTSELQSLMRISYAVFCLKKKTV